MKKTTSSGFHFSFFDFWFPALFCLVALAFSYFFLSSHSTYLMGLLAGNTFFGSFQTGFAQFGLFFLAFLLFFFFRQEKCKVWEILLFFAILSIITFVLGQGIRSFFDGAFFSNLFFAFINIFLFFSVGFIFTVFLSFLGRLLFSKENNFFFRFVVGFFLWGGFSYLLSLLGLFTWEVFLFAFVLAVILFWKKFFKEFRFAFFYETSFSEKWGRLLITCFFAVLLLNFSQIFFPFALGWDSHTHYLLNVKTLAEEGVLRGGIFPPFLEIVLASGATFLGLSFSQFLLLFWGSLGIGVFYGLSRKFGASPLLAGFFSFVFLLLPSVQFQLFRDLKVDIFFFELFLLAIWAWVEYKKTLSAFLFGVASLIKLTALWVWPFFILTVFLQKDSWKKKFGRVALLFLPLFLWGSVNVFLSGNIPTTKQEFLTSFLRTPAHPVKIDFSLVPPKENSDAGAREKFSFQGHTSTQEELGRYANFSRNPFIVLKERLLNSNIPPQSKQYTDTGFLWLALLPFILLSMFFFWKKFSREQKEVSFWMFGFFLFWVFFGFGVPWYGFPFLAFVFLTALFLFWGHLQKGKYVLLFWAVFSLFLGLLSRLEHSAIDAFRTASYWATRKHSTETKDILLKNYYFHELHAAKFLNQDKTARIYRIGGMVRFWILNAENRIFDDPQLDTFASLLSSGRTDEEVLSFLYKQGFRYLIYDKGTPSLEKDRNGTLHKKDDAFRAFAQKNLKAIIASQRFVLFSIEESPLDIVSSETAEASESEQD